MGHRQYDARHAVADALFVKICVIKTFDTRLCVIFMAFFYVRHQCHPITRLPERFGCREVDTAWLYLLPMLFTQCHTEVEHWLASVCTDANVEHVCRHEVVSMLFTQRHTEVKRWLASVNTDAKASMIYNGAKRGNQVDGLPRAQTIL